MLWKISVVLIVHGLLHAMGFAKAFGYATLPQLTQPISRDLGAMELSRAIRSRRRRRTLPARHNLGGHGRRR